GASIFFLQAVNRWSESALQNSRAQAINAEKMAALGEMSGGLAHEINTPLMALQLSATLLKRLASAPKPDAAKIESQPRQIETMIERITKVPTSLQGFSRNAELDPMTATPITGIISDTLELCRERFRIHEIDLQVLDAGPSQAGLVVMCRGVQ